MLKVPPFKYFRVRKFDTAVTEVVFEVGCNASKPAGHANAANYTLLPDDEMYYDHQGLIQALEKAKQGALLHIEQLIKKGADGRDELLRYRMEHYEDLWFNLCDANIRKVEQALSGDPDYVWVPYRIASAQSLNA